MEDVHTVKIRPTRADGLDKIFRPNDPCDTPPWQTKAFCEPVYNDHIVVIHILDIIGGGHSSTVTIGGVVVAAVELIHDQSSSITADVLNLGELRVLHDLACWVTRVRSQDDRHAAGDLISDLIRMDMITIFLREWRRNGRELELN